MKPVLFVDGKLPPTIRSHVIARLRQHRDEAFWDHFFQTVAASAFLTGRTVGTADREPFRATFDWLMGPKNFDKVLTGKYSDTGKPERKRVLVT